MSTYLVICCDIRKGPIAADQVYFQYEKASSFAAHKNHRGLKNKFKKRIFANTFLLHKRTIAKRKVKIKFCKTFLWHPKWTRLFLTWFGVSLHFQNEKNVKHFLNFLLLLYQRFENRIYSSKILLERLIFIFLPHAQHWAEQKTISTAWGDFLLNYASMYIVQYTCINPLYMQFGWKK